ncbi:MAG TPA: hypothetical protein VJ772_00295 [Nitrososphaeraceae archaeon]|nr:hypothetical protein [Nitrososphaeraceae archaeon]
MKMGDKNKDGRYNIKDQKIRAPLNIALITRSQDVNKNSMF